MVWDSVYRTDGSHPFIDHSHLPIVFVKLWFLYQGTFKHFRYAKLKGTISIYYHFISSIYAHEPFWSEGEIKTQPRSFACTYLFPQGYMLQMPFSHIILALLSNSVTKVRVYVWPVNYILPTYMSKCKPGETRTFYTSELSTSSSYYSHCLVGEQPQVSVFY